MIRRPHPALSLVVLLTPVACIGQAQRPNAPPENASSEIATVPAAAVAVSTAVVAEAKKDSPSLSIKHVGDKTTTKVTISWKQETESFLVMSIYEPGQLLEAHPGHPGETWLYGIVLIRRAGAQGEATVTLANEPVTEFLRDRRALINVYLAERLEIEFLGEAPTARIPRSVERSEEVRLEDASRDLRFICATRNAENRSRMMPDAKPWSFDVPEGKGMRVVMDDGGRRAFREISVTFGEDAQRDP